MRVRITGIFATAWLGTNLVYAVSFGVGFDLLLDDGVASIYFANGSYVDLAAVRGSPAYSHNMHLAGRSKPPSSLGFEYGAHNPAQHVFNGLSLRDHLPSWLGGCHSESSTPFTTMLNSLRVATESYLGHSIETVEIAVPFRMSTAFWDSLHQASSMLALNMPLTTSNPAGIYAALAQGLSGSCDFRVMDSADDPAQLILTVAYTDTALTALLVEEECGVFELERVLHDTTLGRVAITRQCEIVSAIDCLIPLTRALSNLIRLPPKDGSGVGLTHINGLVLHGEAADDSRLNYVLKEVLHEHFFTTSIISDIPPLFKAARGLAWQSWYRADRLD